MTHILQDTYQAVSILTSAGFSEKQAKSVIDVLQQANLDDVATKGDIVDLKEGQMKLELKMEQMRNQLLITMVSLIVASFAAQVGIIQMLT